MDDPTKRKRGRPSNASKWLTLDAVADILRSDADVIARLLERAPGTLPGAIRDEDGWMVPERDLRAILGVSQGPLPQMATVDDVATAMRRSVKTVYAWLKVQMRCPRSGKMVPMLPHQRIVGSILVKASDVMALPSRLPGPRPPFFSDKEANSIHE
jgi:hypothetical protein